MPPGASAWSAVAVRPYAALPLAADLALEVSWARVASGLQLNVTLPSGSDGTVSVPKTFGANTTCLEGGRVVWAGGVFVHGVPGVLSGTDDGDFVTFSVTSGAFVFAAQM